MCSSGELPLHCGQSPPRWRWTACRNLGPKRRARRRKLAAVQQCVQLIVSALNWELLGHPKSPPPEARVGFPISDAQHQILEHIEGMVWHHVSMPDFCPSELGRFADKYQDLIRQIQELPQCKLVGKDLSEFVDHLHADLNAYGGHFCHNQDVPDHQCTFETPAPRTGEGVRTVVSERIKWDNPPSFDAVPFLSNPLVREGFINPKVLRLPEHM